MSDEVDNATVQLAVVIDDMQPKVYPDCTVEQSVLRNIVDGCELTSIAKAHKITRQQVQDFYVQRLGELAGLKYMRWSSITDILATGLEHKIRQIFSDPELFALTTPRAIVDLASKASKIASENAKMAVEVQRLPTYASSGKFTKLQRDVYLRFKQMLSEEDIIQRARMGNADMQELCELHKVQWREWDNG